LPLIGHLHTRNQSRFPDNVEYGDIVRGLPVPAASCKGVYCSHVLEHLSLADLRIALRKTREILRPKGVFRLVLPDLEHSVRQYIDNPSGDAAIEFMRETFLGHESRTRGFRGLLASWLGNSRHLWMWDYKSMQRELESAGFGDVRRASFGDSFDPVFMTVEDQGRWENCLGVECRNPG
jgi:predicted SAM-dependent methyltransferase